MVVIRMKRLWLIFAQSATVALGVCLALSVWHPELLAFKVAPPQQVVTLKEAPAASAHRDALVGSYASASAKAQPAVVNIYTSKQVKVPVHPLLNDPLFRRFFGERLPYATQRASSLGSGVIISAEGYIVTNNHVVENATQITVNLQGKNNRPTALEAEVVGTDPETDLAVLKVELDRLPVMALGEATSLQVGDAVLAIGNAPTALFRLLELVDEGVPAPVSVLGSAVGSVVTSVVRSAEVLVGGSPPVSLVGSGSVPALVVASLAVFEVATVSLPPSAKQASRGARRRARGQARRVRGRRGHARRMRARR